MLVSLACSAVTGGGGGTAPTEAPQQSTPQEEQPTAAPQTQGGIDAVRDATIQIEAQGTFVDPEFGLQVNSAGRGTGFIIDPSGIAVTNNHVVAGAALLKVWLNGETTPRNARVVGLSECSDLAVIDIDGDNYPTLNWYSGAAKTGLEVYAAGYPLGEPQFNLTKGIISKENADGETSWASVDHVLGHDATINPGNSGGPLVDANGEVVGINYSSLASANQYFAIGGDIARPVIEELKTGKDVDSIGVNGTAVRSDDGSLSGIWVASVKSGTAADKAGIQPGDIIYQLEGLVLATDGTMKDYCDVIRSHSATDTMTMSVIRYASGELLEGQLNGRELAVTGNFDVSGGSGSSSGGNGSTEAPAFFTEEFEDGFVADNWNYFTLGDGSDTNLVIQQENDHMLFDLGDKNLYVYYMYNPYTYEDVTVRLNAENRGRNNNNVSLVCRMNDDGTEWYEFSVESGGVWYLYAVDGKYNVIDNGGTNALKQGKEVNEYQMTCKGDQITLYVNGSQIKSIRDSTYGFSEGRVGFNISSLNVLPITVEVNWFDIAQP
jgi:S1-C subfamily serine protease